MENILIWMEYLSAWITAGHLVLHLLNYWEQRRWLIATHKQSSEWLNYRLIDIDQSESINEKLSSLCRISLSLLVLILLILLLLSFCETNLSKVFSLLYTYLILWSFKGQLISSCSESLELKKGALSLSWLYSCKCEAQMRRGYCCQVIMTIWILFWGLISTVLHNGLFKWVNGLQSTPASPWQQGNWMGSWRRSISLACLCPQRRCVHVCVCLCMCAA